MVKLLPTARPTDEYLSESPSPPPPSSVMSTRSRRSLSSSVSYLDRSPDKKSVSSSGSRRAKNQSPTKVSNHKPSPSPSLGLVLGDEASSDGVASRADSLKEEEEGEEELDLDQAETNGIDAVDEGEPELDSVHSPIDSDYTPSRKRIASPKKVKQSEPAKQVIRLVFNNKRKAEDDDNDHEEDDDDNHTEPVGNGDLISHADVLSPPPTDVDADADETVVEEQKVAAFKAVTPLGVTNEVPTKRAGRRKRKWLKKGEVDPDDPVAVARQKERHRMIDEAIESLDLQEEMLLASSHPQLVWLWEELERRKNLQLKWLDARHEAAVGDLQNLRTHEQKVTVLDFKVKREELRRTATHDNRQSMEHLVAERVALKRTAGALPNLRAGRGGGGWPVYTQELLSNGVQRTMSVSIDDEPRLRRDVSRGLQSLDSAQIQADIDKFGLVRKVKQRQRSPSASVARSSSSAPQQSQPQVAEDRKPTITTKRQEPPPPPPMPYQSYPDPRPNRDRPQVENNPVKAPASRRHSPEIVHLTTKRADPSPSLPHYALTPPVNGPHARPQHDVGLMDRNDRLPHASSASYHGLGGGPRYSYMVQPQPLSVPAVPKTGGPSSSSAFLHPYGRPQPAPSHPSIGIPPRA